MISAVVVRANHILFIAIGRRQKSKKGLKRMPATRYQQDIDDGFRSKCVVAARQQGKELSLQWFSRLDDGHSFQKRFIRG